MLPLISFSTLACPEWSWDEIVRRARDYGYDGIEVRLVQGETDLRKVSPFVPAHWQRTKRQLEDAGLQICALASSVRFDYPEAAVRAEQVQIARDYVDIARALDVPAIRVFGDVLPPVTEPARRESVLKQIADGLNTIGDYAHAMGRRIILETHGDFADSRLLQQLFERVTSPAVGVLWDTHHPWRFFGEPLAETFARLKPRLWHTHWKDSVLRPQAADHALSADVAAADEKARSLMSGHKPADYILFGGGEFPILECLRLLLSSGYTGWYSLEWEKAWHPQIEPPEIALPLFPPKLRAWATLLGERGA